MSRDALRSIWNSLSERVWVGATTMESPVWTPTGSRFSMEHTAMTLPTLSRMVSNSISFQPKMAFSIKTWVMGEEMCIRDSYSTIPAKICKNQEEI